MEFHQRSCSSVMSAEMWIGRFYLQRGAAHGADEPRARRGFWPARERCRRGRTRWKSRRGLGFAEEQRVQSERSGVPGERRTILVVRIGGALPRRRHAAQINLRANQSRRFAADELRDAAFRERDGQAAFAAIMRALDHAGINQRAQAEVQFFFLSRSQRGGVPVFLP